MNVSEILRTKGSEVFTCTPETFVDRLAQKWKLQNIGSAVVCDSEGSILGVVTERDIMRALATLAADIHETPVREIMNRSFDTCTPKDDLKQVMTRMTQRRVRHLPVVDAGRLVGIVSMGDAVKARLSDAEMETSVLRDVFISSH